MSAPPSPRRTGPLSLRERARVRGPRAGVPRRLIALLDMACREDASIARCAIQAEEISNTNRSKGITEAAMATTLTTKGLVTIAKPIRDRLGIGPGSAVEFEIG